MPTYEYLCQTCSHRFETWQKMIDEPLTTCPECGSHIRRVLYPAGVVFKGSGFYKTDYNKNGAVISDTADDSKKAESKDGATKASNGDGKTGESKTASDASTDTGTAASGTNKSHNSNNSNSSESKSTASASTK